MNQETKQAISQASNAGLIAPDTLAQIGNRNLGDFIGMVPARCSRGRTLSFWKCVGYKLRGYRWLYGEYEILEGDPDWKLIMVPYIV